MKLATVFRDEEENEIPKSSTLNKKIQIYMAHFQIVFQNS